MFLEQGDRVVALGLSLGDSVGEGASGSPG